MRHLKRAEEQLKANKKVELVKQSLALHFEEVDRNKFYEDMATEYYDIYPTTRVMTDEEKLANDTVVDEVNEESIIEREEDYVYPQVEIDYSEDESYVTLEQYKNETRVIQEAVEATYDEEGIILTEAIPEVTELVRPYIPEDVDVIEAKITEYINSKYAELRANAYPPIEEQLDMQYKDILDGGTRFKDAIEAVKAKYPKG